MRQGILLLIGAWSLAGCAAGPVAVRRDYDFSKIRQIQVANLEGVGGSAVAEEFRRQLLARGWDVTDRADSADVILSGSVTQYEPGQKLLVVLGSSTDHSGTTPTVISNPVVPLSGRQVTSEGPAFGLPESRVLSVSATVGVIGRLTDRASGKVVWLDRYTYEGLDVQSAAQAVVDALVKSLERVAGRR